MRVVFNNVLFDDYFDSEFYSNYDVNKNNPPTPLLYSLNFNKLTAEIHDLFEDSSLEEFNNKTGGFQNIPLISMTFIQTQLSFQKTPARRNTFLMSANQIIGKAFYL